MVQRCSVRHLARTGSDHRPLLMKNLVFTTLSRRPGILKCLGILCGFFKISSRLLVKGSPNGLEMKLGISMKLWLSLQESMLRQKSQSQWFEEGEKNTKYFGSILREKKKKRRQQINRIKNRKEKWIKGDEKIAKKAVRHFQTIFNLTPTTINNFILDYIPHCISSEDNNMLSKIPEDNKIKDAVFSLSLHSTSGPNGFNGTFLRIAGT
ncbi:uncharacterized protein [Nicotiana sylvestris]|uniref:uncharacterized protein n=1 Tax=Nicotiana sylvestris TaxID=4096 RepID=UPI00388CBF33